MLNLYYIAIEKKLKTLPQLKEIAWFNGQYMPDEEGDFFFDEPAVYVEFLDCVTTGMIGSKGQQINLNFRLHVATLHLEDSVRQHLGSSLIQPHHAIVNDVHAAIHGYKPMLSAIPGSESLLGTPEDLLLFGFPARKVIKPIHNVIGLMVTTMDYEAISYDYSAQPVYNRVQAQLALTIQ